MNKLLFGLLASAVLAIAAPANAQVFIGATPAVQACKLVRSGQAWALDFRTTVTIIAAAMTRTPTTAVTAA